MPGGISRFRFDSRIILTESNAGQHLVKPHFISVVCFTCLLINRLVRRYYYHLLLVKQSIRQITKSFAVTQIKNSVYQDSVYQVSTIRFFRHINQNRNQKTSFDSHISQSKTNTNIKNRAKLNTQRSHLFEKLFHLFEKCHSFSRIDAQGSSYTWLLHVSLLKFVQFYQSSKRFERKPANSNNILSY